MKGMLPKVAVGIGAITLVITASLPFVSDAAMITIRGGKWRVSGGGASIGSNEYQPRFFATTNYNSYTALNGDAHGMRDGTNVTSDSVHGTVFTTNQAITADLGSTKPISYIVLMDISSSNPDGWGPAYTNGTILQGSDDNASYTTITTISGLVDNVPHRVNVNANYRYLRLFMANYYVAAGDFRIYR